MFVAGLKWQVTFLSWCQPASKKNESAHSRNEPWRSKPSTKSVNCLSVGSSSTSPATASTRNTKHQQTATLHSSNCYWQQTLKLLTKTPGRQTFLLIFPTLTQHKNNSNNDFNNRNNISTSRSEQQTHTTASANSTITQYQLLSTANNKITHNNISTRYSTRVSSNRQQQHQQHQQPWWHRQYH